MSSFSDDLAHLHKMKKENVLMTMTKKIVSLLLALMLFLSCAAALSSCQSTSSTDTPKDTSSSDANDTAEETIELPSVTEYDFDDYEFKILISSRSGRTPNDFEADSDSGSAMSQAIYKRYLRMDSKYNLVITVEEDLRENHEAAQKMEIQYSSSTNNYDMGVINTYAVAPITTSGHLYDLNSVPNLDLSKSWWDQTVVEGLTISDTIYYVCGDITTTVDDYMYCTIFNKGLYKEYVTDGTDVYQLVADGKWTLDQLARLTKLVQDGDVNGDGFMTGKDKYGLMTWNDEMYASVQAAGGRIAKVNDDGEIELCLQSERNFDVMVKYTDIHTAHTTLNFQDTEKLDGVQWWKVFEEDRAMFFMTLINEVSRFRDMKTNYGILPNPKYDEAQENWYCTFSAGLASFICIPGYQEDIDRTGIAIDLLGYEAIDTITPGYYDKTLKGKYVHDDQSIDSLSVILDNKFVDIGHYYRVGGLNLVLYNVAKNGTAGSFAAQYQAARPTAEADIARINEAMQQLKLAN